jgi:transmembrane sensor
MQKDLLTEIDPAAPLTEQACHWWVLLNSGEATPADHRTFGEWVARSPERIEAYLQVARVTQALKSDKFRWPGTPVEDLIREAKAAGGDLVRLPDPPGRGGENRNLRVGAPSQQSEAILGRRRSLRLGAAAVALVAAAGGLMLLAGSKYYHTALGEQRSVVLGDGSVVTLNTSSSIEVCLRKHRRTVRLLSGEALFQVAHDATRPFEVSVGDTTVQAVGTQFDVERRASGTTVTVVEGKVAVLVPPDVSDAADARKAAIEAGAALASTTLPLAAGEQLTVERHAAPRRSRADLAVTMAWMQRKLIFEHRPLGEVADEFNRYNRRTIEILGPALRDQQVTGVFQANDPESFIDFLSKVPDVTIERSNDGSRYIVTSTNPIHR